MTRGDAGYWVLMAVLLAVVALLFGAAFWVQWQSLTAPCESLAWVTQKNIPARCVEYWSK